MSGGSSADRLNRLLALVPYLLAHPGVHKGRAAEELGVTRDQLDKDLDQLWMCGLPGGYPDDLIDLSFGPDDTVTVTFSAGIDRPLRLTAAEASVLLMALRALLDVPGLIDTDAARRAAAKVDQAFGTPAGDSANTTSGVSPDRTTPDFSATVRDAVTSRRALRIRYYSASRDAVSQRTVDPVRIQSVDTFSYLEAWCRDAEAIRLFRLDRIENAELLDEPATVPAVPEVGESLALFHSDPSLPTVTLEIDPDVAWVIDYYLIEPLTAAADTAPEQPIIATMTYGSTEWLIRFLLGFGGQIRLQSSPEISAEVAARSSKALQAYGSADNTA
ncbi:YafY family protein [Williamsia sp. CHRR-6]|uniref:helix-turn-helix transcriptional regulator n=1 Tax=Williamsia sp. CHRR-6 TaxID=2835871 RepID=UPI001BDA39BA|nr:YafY family protein [Williamsia sp. CHRR-6]MBT0568118.1 YafY family transcriptional regulator [Williamsia sp. CHRR-6]